MKKEKKCETCGNLFAIKSNHPEKQTCSKECLYELRCKQRTGKKRNRKIKVRIKEKVCATCGETFDPKRHPETLNCSPECIKKYHEKHKDERIKKSQDALITKYGKPTFFAVPGSHEKTKQTKKERYGNENFVNHEKYKETMLQKYGVENPMQVEESKNKSKQTKREKYGDENFNNREQAKETCKEKYGVEHHLQSEECLNKMKQTNSDTYGVEYTLLIDKCIENAIKATQEKYGVDYFFSSIEHLDRQREKAIQSIRKLLKERNLIFDETEYEKLRHKFEDGSVEYTLYKIECETCGHEFESYLTENSLICRKCHPKKSQSEFEQEIKNYIENELGFKTKTDRKIIVPLELDIVVLSTNIAIEADGNYFHSEKGNNKDENYHLNKTQRCKEAGYRLIHVLEDEWEFKKEIVKSRLKDIISKNNRQITEYKIKEIDSDACISFLKENDLYYSNFEIINEQEKYYGAFDEGNNIVSAMRVLQGEKEVFVMNFCYAKGVVVESALSEFIKFVSLQKITYFADCRWDDYNFENTLFAKNGFDFKEYIRPSFSCIINHDYYNRMSPEHVESIKESVEIKEIDRIWDCGKMMFEKIFS